MTPSDIPPAPTLAGDLGELRFTLEITRKETGKTETVELVGKVIKDEKEATE